MQKTGSCLPRFICLDHAPCLGALRNSSLQAFHLPPYSAMSLVDTPEAGQVVVGKCDWLHDVMRFISIATMSVEEQTCSRILWLQQQVFSVVALRLFSQISTLTFTSWLLSQKDCFWIFIVASVSNTGLFVIELLAFVLLRLSLFINNWTTVTNVIGWR